MFVDSKSKFDIETKAASYWVTPKHTPGEASFIVDPAQSNEDSGFLLSVILDGEEATSYMLCLDAETMLEIGRAEAGVAVGLGFMGVMLRSDGFLVRVSLMST